MKRFLWLLNWLGLVGAVACAATLAVAWVSDDVHELTSYGLASGPGAHTGYGALGELVFIGLPAAGFYVLALVAALLWRARYGASFLKHLGRVTAGLLAVGGAVGAFEAVVDHLSSRESQRVQAEIARGAAIAADHDALGAYARSHDVNAVLPGGATTPLHAAVEHPFPDLVRELVGKGASVSDDDLTAASRTGNAEVLTLLLDHEHGLPGRRALEAAYAVANDGALRLLLSRGVHAGPALSGLVDGRSFRLFPGEVDWAALGERWSADASTPASIANAISLRAGRPFAATESDVLEVIDGVLGSSDFCIDRKIALPALAIDAWMKERDLCTCNYCPYARPINWAILATLYAGEIPPLSSTKAFAMFRLLAHSAASSEDDPRPILSTAASQQNVEVMRALEEEGFDIHALDGQLDEGSFSPDSRQGARMRAHLIEKGVRWRG